MKPSSLSSWDEDEVGGGGSDGAQSDGVRLGRTSSPVLVVFVVRQLKILLKREREREREEEREMDRRWLIVPLASSLMLALANSVSGRPSTDDSVQRQGAAGHFLFPIGGRQFSQIKIRKTTTTTTTTTTNAVASKSVLKLQDDRTTKELGRKLGQKKKNFSRFD